MSDTTAKINTATGAGTGIDEELARKLFDKGAGATLMATVELRVVRPHGPDLDGKRQVDLNIIGLQPVYEDAETEEHLRNLGRRLWHERKVATTGEELPLDDVQAGAEPTVAEVRKAGKQYEPHEFIQAPGELDNQVCDMCGKPKFAQIHDDIPDPAALDADDQDDQPADG